MNKYPVLILIIALFFSCKNSKKEIETKSETLEETIISTDKFNKLGLVLESVKFQAMTKVITANGIVDIPPDHTFQISYPLSGTIKSMGHNLLPGKYVKKGELLAVVQSLDLLSIKENYLLEKANIEMLTLEFERQTLLLETEATSKKKLQESQSQLKIAQIKLSAISEKLKAININPAEISREKLGAIQAIYAPSAGFIKTANISNGKSILQNDILFEIINTEHMHAELKILGADMKLVKIGQEVEFSTSLGTKAMGRIHLIDKNIDADAKSLNIHVHIENEAFEQSLIAGQYISGNIYLGKSNIQALPSSAVLNTPDGIFAFEAIPIKSGYKIQKKLIEKGVSNGQFIELKNATKFQGSYFGNNLNVVEQIYEGN